MHRGLSGFYLPISTVGEPVRAFVPLPLPPDPTLALSGPLDELLDAASVALATT